MTDHQMFPKIPRLQKVNVVITEKLDGTNAVIWLSPDKSEMKVGSRNRWVGDSKLEDNSGFYQFCQENKEYLMRLHPGFNYGEFMGPKIQGNRYELEKKELYLFDTRRAGEFEDTNTIKVVPHLMTTPLDDLPEHLSKYNNMKSTLNPKANAEGVMLYFTELNKYIKVIYDK